MKSWSSFVVKGNWAVLAIAIAGLASVADQSVESTPFVGPRLIVNSNGATQGVTGLSFSADSKRLFAGSFDGVVHIWDLHRSPSDGTTQAIYARVLRLESSGAIQSRIGRMELSPLDGRVAVTREFRSEGDGGFAIFNSNTGAVETSRLGDIGTAYSLAFSPDGKRFALGLRNGDLKVFEVGSWNPLPVDTHASAGKGPLVVAFAGPDKIVASGVVEDSRASFTVHDLRSRPPTSRDLPTNGANRVFKLLGDRLGKYFVAADGRQGVQIVMLDGESPERLQSKSMLINAAIDENGLLFTMGMLPRGNNLPQRAMQAFSLKSRQVVDQMEFATGSKPGTEVATSPDGRYLACTATATENVLLISLRGPDDRLLDKPLTDGKRTLLKRRIPGVLKVAFSADDSLRLGIGNRIAVPRKFNDYAAVERAFDLKEPRLLPKEQGPKWRTADVPGWNVRFETGPLVVVTEDGQKEPTFRFEPDRYRFQQIACYCLLPDVRGRPYAIVLGANSMGGVSVYRLDRPGRSPAVRFFENQGDKVVSLSVSNDRRWLATASLSGVIQILSLEGLQDNAPRPFERADFWSRAGWGADFVARDGRVAIESIVPDGPVASHGLQNGDIVVEGHFTPALDLPIGPSDFMPSPGELPHTTTARDEQGIIQGIKGHALEREIVLTIQRPNEVSPRRLRFTPGWRAKANLIVDDGNDWAFASDGAFAASMQGDNLVGWMRSRGPNARPSVVTAEQLRHSFEDREAMKRLLFEVGTKPGVGPTALERVEKLDRTIYDLPALTITQPLDGQSSEARPGQIVVRAQSYNNRPLGKLAFRAFVNGVPIGTKVVEATGQSAHVDWRIEPFDEYNRVRVVARKADGPVDGDFAAAEIRFRAGPSSRNPKLHLLALAAGDYPGNWRLNSAVSDVKSLIERFVKRRAGGHLPGALAEIYDRELTPAAVDKSINLLFDRVGGVPCNDLAIVVVSCHYAFLENECYLLPPENGLERMDRTRLREFVAHSGISWQAMRRLASLPCRKLFIFDDPRGSGRVAIGASPTGDVTAKDDSVFSVLQSAHDSSVSRESLLHFQSALRALSLEDALVMAAVYPRIPVDREVPSQMTPTMVGCVIDCLDKSRGGNGITIKDLSTHARLGRPDLNGGLSPYCTAPLALFDVLDLPICK